MRPLRLALVVVVLGAVLAHQRCLSHGFVYDDHRFIVRNEAIATLERPWRFFTDPSTASAAQGVEPDVWRPLRTLDFAVDRALFGLDPRGWHAESLAWHVLNAALVCLLLARVLSRDGTPRGVGAAGAAAAAGGALAFAVHPSTVESVAWVSSRGDLVAWTLVLAALAVGRRRGVLATLGCGALVALGCLAKESAVVAFALLPLHHLALPEPARPARRETVLRTALLLAVSVAYLAVRSAVLPTPSDLTAFAQTAFPDGGRPAAARGFLAAVTWYARVLIWPSGFPFDRNVHTDPVPLSWSEPVVVVGAAVVLSLAVAGARALRRRGPVPFSTWGPLAVLVPVSSVLVPLKAFAAERFLYPALPCLAVGAVAAALALARRLPGALRAAVPVAAALVLVGLGAAADARSRPWADDLSLWTAVQREEPMNPRASEGLAFEAMRAGRYGVAERALRLYRELQPDDGKAHALLADNLRGLYDELLSKEDPAAAAAGTDRLLLPRFVLEKAIEESRAAVFAWERVGLARGRGDAALRRRTLEGWRAAALDFGALPEARRVNDLLAADDKATSGAVAWAQRRMAVVVALLGLALPAGTTPAQDLERRRVRAEVLEAVGVDPARDDAAAYEELEPRVAALLAERPEDEALRRHRLRGLALRLEALPPAEQAAALATMEEDLTALLRRHPSDAGLRQNLETVRLRRSR